MREREQSTDQADFASLAGERVRPGIAVEFWEFIRESKKWWLAPIVIWVLGLGALVLLGGTPASSFIYTLY